MSRPRSNFPEVVAVDLAGVVLGSHALTEHTKRFERMVGIVGRRLMHWLKTTAQEQPLPPPEWTEAFRYYQAALMGLLREQRERVRLTLGEQASPEQLQAQFREELQRALESFSPAERAFTLALWDSNNGPQPTTTETPQ